ncbi:TPA: helix-turn-helix domain-containing protein [Klebsiella pneumoniae]|uniref:helix-turn-helix domain-containing protein n=1 Tax=Escherichia coli TaxID=562 RepID=UPI001B04CD5C|nr:helix-turn-helix domain-containing protein [Escherichia coli]HAW3738722.1 helix-turn-helix domain-containing protein [Escherichia coli]HAW4315716.1 helix-turn-helix domain-containing protein [Escherichia coli]HAX6699136.1 helix-turn-helix domain-containing protein [Escherichia coli]HAX7388771.1 helix-turn-helix domain-containing protein [Escherichia coli]HBA5341329.1 helix-turn-helix domain-containing protein [Escherichia coli]
MQKRLNTDKAQQAIDKAGLTQTAVADALGVTKEAVSQWLLHKSFPRPNKLLQLGKLLNLAFDDLIIKEDPHAPKVAFRKMRGTKTKDHHIEKAQEIGRFLRHLVPYLPFDTFEMPPVLKSPSCDYDYLRTVTAKVREDINLGPIECVDFTHLIRRFSELQAVVVPVMWGAKQRHENAVHIHLPDSGSTWVYLNLDTNIHDFKFWMAHELGHCLSPSLEGDDAEDFADAFAASLLYPHELAEQAYASIMSQVSPAAKIAHVIGLADQLTISPWTVIGQVNKYAESAGQPQIQLSKSAFPAAVTNFNKKYKNLSEALFGNTELDEHSHPSARDYIEKAEGAFETPFFDLLRKYLKEHDKGPGYVQTVLDMPLLDARSIHAELI